MPRVRRHKNCCTSFTQQESQGSRSNPAIDSQIRDDPSQYADQVGAPGTREATMSANMEGPEDRKVPADLWAVDRPCVANSEGRGRDTHDNRPLSDGGLYLH